MDTVNEIVKKIDEGKIVYLEEEADAKNLSWDAHPTFKGVFLKHLVKGEKTDGESGRSRPHALESVR